MSQPKPPRPDAPCRPRRGLTLVECMVALAILGILAGLAGPGWEQARTRRHLEGVAAQFETDVQLARSQVVARNEPLRIAFEAGAGAGCYLLHSGPAGACRCGESGSASCTDGAEALRVFRLEPSTGVRMSANVTAIVFDPRQGTSSPAGTLRIESADGRGSVRQVVNIMGRVRGCSPDGVPGYRRC